MKKLFDVILNQDISLVRDLAPVKRLVPGMVQI